MDEDRHLTVIEREAQNTLFATLQRYDRTLAAVLPKTLTLERWKWLVVNSIRKTPALAGCSPFSFINAVLLASNLGIEIRDRSSYLVPFNKECSLLIDYRAKIDLAAKAGVTIYPPQLVREADGFEYGWSGENLIFRHSPAIVETRGGKLAPVEERGKVVAGWTAAKNAIGHTVVLVMGLADIDRIRKRSRKGFPEKTFEELCNTDVSKITIPYRDRGPWLTDAERMAEKTLVHQIFNRVPQTPEMALSQDVDAALESERATKPIAREMEQVYLELDPADDKAMVDGGGDTPDEQRASRQAVVDRKLRTCSKCGQAGHDARNCQQRVSRAAVREVDDLPDTLEVQDDRIYCKGVLYGRNDDNTAWRPITNGTT